MGSITGDRRNSQASATCVGLARWLRDSVKDLAGNFTAPVGTKV